jgi:hypothetical protein
VPDESNPIYLFNETLCSPYHIASNDEIINYEFKKCGSGSGLIIDTIPVSTWMNWMKEQSKSGPIVELRTSRCASFKEFESFGADFFRCNLQNAGI